MAFFVDARRTIPTMPGVAPRLLLMLLLSITAAVYIPALDSGYYIDDYYNLRDLSEVAARGYGSYVLSGISGPAGRPLSLLSFAVQHESWPQSPADFKAVNLALHLLIGFLIGVLARRLGRHLNVGERQASWVGVVAAGVWLLHPMQLTTVLYTIQRMTQLCTLFVLLGLLGFLAGRRLCELRRPRQGYALMSIAIAAGTFLAVLSKENGVLLPLLALIMDVTLLAGAPAIAGYARWRAVFLILPSILILSLLIGHIPEAARSFELRPYSMYQKTLTEAVVLFQYLGNLFLPRPDAFGLYHDDFPISLGILDPPHTLAAVLGAAGLLAAAILARRKAPVAAFAMLWFFAGHLIESSFLNLAIYFEHRNYLPSAGIAFLIAWTGAGPGISAGTERFLRAGLTVFIVLLALASLANAKLWRDHLDLAEQAVRTHPRSPWALTSLGNSYLRNARLADAGRLYGYIAEQFPREIYPQIKEAAVAACILNRAPPDAWWEGVIAQGRSAAPAGFDQVAELSGLISAIIGGECQALDQGRLLQLIEALAENPDFRRETGALHDLAGNLCLHRRDWGRAYRHLSESVRALPTVERRLHLIDLQLAMKKQGEALDEANRLEQDLRSRPVAWLGYRNQIRTLRERIHALQETD